MQITIAQLSEANRNSRMDSQFFHPAYVETINIISNKNYSVVDNIAHITDGNHLKIAEHFDNSKGVRYLRGQDLSTDMILNDRNIVHIPEASFNNLERSHIFKDDILVTIVGANTGLVGLVYNPPEKLVANCKLGIIRPYTTRILSGYLYAFLIGRFGQHQLLRSIRGGGQTGLILPDLRSLNITRLSNEFESKIQKVVFSGHFKQAESKKVYEKIQNSILSELKLDSSQPKHQLSFIKNYSETQQAGRLDAEYYQPKYDEIINAIKSYSDGWKTLGNIVDIKKCIEVGGSEYLSEGVPFIRVSNISPFEMTKEKYISDWLYNELTPTEEDVPFEQSKNHQPKQGEILFSKDGTPGIAHYLKEQPQKMIPSGGILRLKNKTNNINNEYLTLVLNSVLIQEQINRDVGGSIILHWRPDRVRETVIPVLSEAKQLKIQQKVTESFNLRKDAKHLLDCAKKAVEMAIEKNEEVATKWLKEQTKGIDLTASEF